MEHLMKKLILLFFLISLTSCDFVRKVETKAKKVNNYERVSLNLAKENRELMAEINSLKFEIQSLKSENNFLALQLEKKKERGRGIASVPADASNDLVKHKVYDWTPEQLLAVAEKEFDNKNFDKSAQFFKTFLDTFPKHKQIDDQLLFQAGVASYESGKYHDWTLNILSKLMNDYPTSKFYRGAKLWVALTNLKQGKTQQFYNTVEEFRKKYRNTPEWKILRNHYEKIRQKYKKN